MTEATRYTITVGNNTSVAATEYKLDDAQLKQLEALVRSGDISLDPSNGVITVKTAKGLVSAGAIAGVSVDELMEIDDLPAEIFRGMTHESTMAAINRFSTTDPKEMSLSELMSYMFMLIYQSESDRREALQTAKGAQLLIQMQQAAMQWAQSREAAEKEYANTLTSAIGQIVGGAISAGMSIAGGITQSMANKRSRIAKAKKIELKKYKLGQKYQYIQKERDANDAVFETRAKEKALANANAIKEKQRKQKANNEEINKLPKGKTRTKLEAENSQLGKEIENLENDNKKLGYNESGDKLANAVTDYGNSSLNNSKEYQAKAKSDVKLAKYNTKIKELGGEIHGDGTVTDKGGSVPWGKVPKANGEDWLQDVDSNALKKEKEFYKEKAKKWGLVANALQASAGAASAVVQGIAGIFAAHHAKDAAFLRAEAQLTDAFRNFASLQVQNIDQSAEQALRQLGTLISSLKEVFRAAYDIECSIARNI